MYKNVSNRYGSPLFSVPSGTASPREARRFSDGSGATCHQMTIKDLGKSWKVKISLKTDQIENFFTSLFKPPMKSCSLKGFVSKWSYCKDLAALDQSTASKSNWRFLVDKPWWTSCLQPCSCDFWNDLERMKCHEISKFMTCCKATQSQILCLGIASGWPQYKCLKGWMLRMLHVGRGAALFQHQNASNHIKTCFPKLQHLPCFFRFLTIFTQLLPFFAIEIGSAGGSQLTGPPPRRHRLPRRRLRGLRRGAAGGARRRGAGRPEGGLGIQNRWLLLIDFNWFLYMFIDLLNSLVFRLVLFDKSNGWSEQKKRWFRIYWVDWRLGSCNGMLACGLTNKGISIRWILLFPACGDGNISNLKWNGRVGVNLGMAVESLRQQNIFQCSK